MREPASTAQESVSADLTGTLELAIAKMLPDFEVTAVFLELGTVSPIPVFRAMQAENWLHHHGAANNPRNDKIKAALLRAFYPDADDWKARIWAQGREGHCQSKLIAPAFPALTSLGTGIKRRFAWS